MTQLEEYLEQREELYRRIRECFDMSFDKQLPSDERRTISKKRMMYQAMMEDLDVQIRAIDPNVLEPKKQKKVKGKSVSSLDKPILDGGMTFGDRIPVHADIGGDTIPYDHGHEDKEQDEELQEQIAERQRALVVAAQHLSPRQAEVLELRYNSGYSITKVAETMGCSVQVVMQKLARANGILEDWAAITEAVKVCTYSDAVFDFAEFKEQAPHAFPQSRWEIIMTLYDAPLSRFRTVASLAAALGRNNMLVGRQLGQIKALCHMYGIPGRAIHPLIQNNSHADYDANIAFRYFEMNRKAPRTCGYLHNDAEKNFKARDPAFQYQSLEDAVRGQLTATYNLPAATPGLSEFIDEGLRMFDEEKLSLARERLDGGKTLAACNSTIPREIRARIIRDVLEVTALYAYFRYDTQRIYAGTDIWNALFARWECFPGSTGDMLRLLLDSPELPQIKMLAGMIGRSEASALEKVRKIAFYCRWWGIPSALLPYLVRKHLDDKVGIRRGVFSFRRAVSLRHDPFACAGDEIDVGTQAIAGRPGNDHRRERVGSHRESGYASDFGAQWNSARSGRLVDRPQ